jgi:hypothetical protein
MNNSFFEPPPHTKWNVLNLGAGVQSSTMALMAARGEITPHIDFAVFADTQAEPTSVYDWLDYLEKEINKCPYPFPIYRVTKGNLTDDSLKIVYRKKTGLKSMRRLIPLFGIKPNGEVTAAIGRTCTADYKVAPILKEIRKRCGITHGQKEVTVTQWIGISYDEMQRMKLPINKWTQHRWVLVEKKMTRAHCKEWMKKNNYPEPPRSACYYCPFHSDSEWRRLRNEDPYHFQKAIDFDNKIRQMYKTEQKDMKMEVYLHSSCKPLSDIDFDSDEDKGQLGFDFQSECEGMCGL